MSSSPPSAPQSPPPDVLSPYFREVMLTILHRGNIQGRLQGLQETETEIRKEEETMRETQENLQEILEEKLAEIKDLLSAQPDEALYLGESQRLVKELSLISVVIEAFKRQAEAQTIDIERAVMNATQQPIVGAKSEKESSLRKRRANYYGVMTVGLRNERNKLKAAKLRCEAKVNSCRTSRGNLQQMIDKIQHRMEKNQAESLAAWRQYFGDMQAVRHEQQSLLILEQERLSRSVVDLVLEWKRNKPEV